MDENEYGEDDESVESSPKREVFIRKSKSQRRNQRRRYRTRVTRNQANIHVKERLDASHPKMRLGKGAPKNTRQKSRTPSTEILSDDDARAKPRSVSPGTTAEMTNEWKKKPWRQHIERDVKVRGWESQESEEEEDVQDTKVPKNNKKNRRK